MTLYNTIKRMTRSYAAPVMGVVLSCMAGCGGESALPVSDDAKNALAGVNAKAVIEHNSLMSKATDLFNEGIEDTFYSLKEQTETYKAIGKAENYGSTKGLSLKPELESLSDLIWENQSGCDWFRPELSKKLEESHGVYVTVEKAAVPTELDFVVPLISVIAAEILGIIGYESVFGKH